MALKTSMTWDEDVFGLEYDLDVFNIANVRWNDIEYYYASRLQHEASSQADYVVHPGVPRTLRAQFTYYF